MYSKRLRDVELFRGLSNRDLEALSQLVDEVEVDAGRVLAREGDFGREFFVICDGTAEVTRDGKHVAELGSGDFFGEIALIEEERRTATVTAMTPMKLVVLPAREFRSLRLTLPSVYSTVREEIVRRRPVPA